jgi:hypothetical protein
MKALTLVFSAALCLTAFPAFARATPVSNNFITLAQAEVTVGPDGIRIDERERDRVRDHDRFDRDHDRDKVRVGEHCCRTVTVQERWETRGTQATLRPANQDRKARPAKMQPEAPLELFGPSMSLRLPASRASVC